MCRIRQLSFTTASVQAFRMLPFIRSHGEDDGLYALEGVVVHVHILESLAHSRNHGCEVLDVTHLLDLLDLVIEIPKGELVLGQLLLELSCLLFVELLLSLLHERNDVTQAENTVGDT